MQYECMIHLIIIFIIYSLYVQLSPTMGNIWMREDSSGNLVFCPLGLLHLCVAPLNTDKMYLWEPVFWPINFFVYIVAYFIVYLFVKDYNHIPFLTLNVKVHECQQR